MSTSYALIGHTGLVGSNLMRQFRFDACYNSSNIQEIAGKHHELLVCSGVSGTKWLANQKPDEDRAAIASLLAQLKQCTADEVILISSVDVYAEPSNVDEDSAIDTSRLHPYGTHRYQFEKDVCDLFPNVHIARLPAIYGWNLRKNALYDLMHRHELEKIHPDAKYQFYWLEHLWRDLQQARQLGLRIINLATEPLGIQEVANEVFGIHLSGQPPVTPAAYDFRTKYAENFGGAKGYLYDKSTALEEIRTFVKQQQLCAPY
ncbi:MAG: hypothetical protein EAZ81_05610 [Verrucomicrobia bacterium]|nr:MAG: hypothetical protein EAZ81_05610 [Verrucomicrobiota bacterium]